MEERLRENRQRLLKQPKQERMEACSRTESIRMESWTGLGRGKRNSILVYSWETAVILLLVAYVCTHAHSHT